MPHFTKSICYLIIYLVMFCLFNSCKEVDPFFDAKGDIAKGNIHFISYGLSVPSPNSNWKIVKQIDSLNHVYGVSYENRGCVIPDSIDRIKLEEYNYIIEQYLVEKNGKDWRKKYNDQLDSLEKLKLLPDSIK